MGIKIAAASSALVFVSTLAVAPGITQSVHHNLAPASESPRAEQSPVSADSAAVSVSRRCDAGEPPALQIAQTSVSRPCDAGEPPALLIAQTSVSRRSNAGEPPALQIAQTSVSRPCDAGEPPVLNIAQTSVSRTANAGEPPALHIAQTSVSRPANAGEPPALHDGPIHLAQNLVGAVQKYTDDSGIMVVYPRGDKVPASSTYIAGAVATGSTLTCNGEPVRLSPEGFFAHVVSLKPGTNVATLQMQPGGRTREVKIEREIPPPPVPAGGCKIDQSTCVPRVAKGIVSGDMIEFSVRATPGQEVTASIGKRKIVLHAPASNASKRHHKGKTTARPGSPVNRGLDAAYGKVYQRSAASPGDLYVGSYKVQPDDRWNGLAVKYTLRTESKSTSAISPGRLTTLAQPIFAETAHDKTIVRTGPGQGRITPLPAGVRLLIDGWYDDSMRCLYAPNHHYWIKKDDLFENQGQQSDTPPDSVARTINVGADDYGATITVPLSQKLPFSIEQQTKPSRLNLRIYGVTADTDWVTPPNSEAQQLVDSVTWKQGGDGIYEVSALLKHSSQWGFKAEYHDTNLVLHIKAAPHLIKGPNHIEGLKICVDPGHGGTESGAIGCSGVREADINLAIALKLKRLLEQEGASVTMTRIGDKDVSLEDRVAIAEAANVDILLSVHNNALPDGRDPWAEHGTSTYWYHPQSIQLAHQLKDDMVKTVGFPDFGSRFQNLALTRPSSMLATLVEVGFVIDPPEYAQLISSSGQQKAAQGIIDGLANYLMKQSGFEGYGSRSIRRGKQ